MKNRTSVCIRYVAGYYMTPDAHMLGSRIDRVARGQLTSMSTLLSSISSAGQGPFAVKYSTAAASDVGMITRATPQRVCRTTKQEGVKLQVSIHGRSCWDPIMDLSRSQVTSGTRQKYTVHTETLALSPIRHHSAETERQRFGANSPATPAARAAQHPLEHLSRTGQSAPIAPPGTTPLQGPSRPVIRSREPNP